MNETRITSYALNELHGSERDTFEADLAADPDLQRELQAISRLADSLENIMTEPREGLDPRAKERLIRVIEENQKNFQRRRKIVRFAVPVSLAAAASIAVLLLVPGGKTTQEPAMAAGVEAPGERVFVRSEAANIASGAPSETDRASNAVVPRKRVMPWDARVLGADVDPAKTGGQ